MRRSLTALLAVLLAGPALAGEDASEAAPEFLLGDVGVRVDLPGGWRMTRWSDWDLKAETSDPILLEAWASEIQTDPSKVDAKVWAAIYDAKLSEMGAGDGAKLTGAKVETIAGQPVALLDYTFKLKSGTPAVLRGATLSVDGQMFHLALVTVDRFAKKADKTRTELIDQLDVKKGPANVTWGPTLEGDGFTHELPEGWREPLKAETSAVNKQIAHLGLEKMDGCWLAMRPKGPDAPDAMVTCQGGALLGVVDSYSFDGVEEEVRKKMFGAAEIPAGRMLELEDRVAFVYDLHEKGLAVGVVPYDKGLARTWVVGKGDDLAAALEEALKGSTYSGYHPASIGDRVSYWVTYRPFSPVVLCPALSLLVFGGVGALGVGALMARGRKNKYADLDD